MGEFLASSQFPEPFSADRTLLGPGTFEVRKASTPPGDELMFGMRSLDGLVSDNHYAVRADGSFRVRPVRDEEWNLSEPVSLREHSLDGSQWKEGTFQPSGAQLHGAMLSPDETMIALLSQTETERPKGVGVFILPTSGTYQGTTYLDLFDTSSGERVGAAQAPYVGGIGAIAFGNATWIDDRSFVAPLRPLGQTCLLAIRLIR